MGKSTEVTVTAALGDKELGIYWNFGDKYRAQRFGKVASVETFLTVKECKEFITGKKMKVMNEVVSSEPKKVRAPRGAYQKFISEKHTLYQGKLSINDIIILAEQAPEFANLDSKAVEASIRFYFKHTKQCI